jgi:peptidoglycan/LPS O-acetylase OafA/YrhL
MITGTLLVILFAPLFYVVIEKTFGKRKPQPAANSAAATPSGNQ